MTSNVNKWIKVSSSKVSPVNGPNYFVKVFCSRKYLPENKNRKKCNRMNGIVFKVISKWFIDRRCASLSREWLEFLTVSFTNSGFVCVIRGNLVGKSRTGSRLSISYHNMIQIRIKSYQLAVCVCNLRTGISHLLFISLLRNFWVALHDELFLNVT